MTQRRFGYIFCVFFLISLALPRAQAQDVEAVANLQLEFCRDGSAHIKCTWDANPDQPDHYSIFTGFAEAGQLRFYTICRKEEVRIPISRAGRYYIMLLAQRGSQVSPANIRFIDISDADVLGPNHGGQINFSSTPPQGVITGELYSYTPTAEERDNQELQFDLPEKPYGMQVNAQSGAISWTPTQAGEFEVTLRARLVHDPSVEALQHWHIKVVRPENNPLLPCTDVTVFVELPDSAPIYYATVTAIRTNRELSATQKYAVRDADVISTTVSNGRANFKLAAGEYIFRVQADEIATTWSGDTQYAHAAEPLEVTCQYQGPAPQIQITARPRKAKVRKSLIEGQVRDSSTARGVPSMVVFQPAPSHPKPDILGAGNLHVVFTDQSGNFTASLLEDVPYIAEAICLLVDANTELPIYSNRFNGDQVSPLQAPILRPKNFTQQTRLNFNLLRLPASNSLISFEIVDPAESLRLGGTVILYRVDRSTEPWTFAVVRSESASAAQILKVHKLVPGEYVAQFVPWNAGHPTHYFGPDAQPVLNMQDARVFALQDGDSGMFEARISRLAPLQGVLHTRGQTFEWLQGSSAPQSSHGALVYAFDESGLLLDYAISDENGNFLLDRLGLGRYYLTIAKGNCHAAPQLVERSYTTFSQTIDPSEISCDERVTSAKTTQQPAADSGPAITLMPHPANSTLRVSVAADAFSGEHQCHIQLSDLTGNQVLQTQQILCRGRSDLTLDISHLLDGMYVLEITDGRKTLRQLLIVAR